jgi:hypothetical protein
MMPEAESARRFSVLVVERAGQTVSLKRGDVAVLSLQTDRDTKDVEWLVNALQSALRWEP